MVQKRPNLFLGVQGGLFPPAPVASSRLFLAPQAGLLTRVLVPFVGRLRSPGGATTWCNPFLMLAHRVGVGDRGGYSRGIRPPPLPPRLPTCAPS